MGRYLRTKIFLLAGTLVGIFVLVSSLLPLFKKEVSFLPKVFPPMDADIQIRDFSFIQTVRGHNEWEIKARRAELFEEQKQAVLQDLDVRFLLPQGWGMTFHGEQGQLDTEKSDFEITSGSQMMEIAFNNGYTILTRSLKWTNQEQRIRTTDPVEIQGPGFKISGQGLEASLGSKEMKVLSDVHAQIF